MNKITKSNIDTFIAYYHDFHDSYITNIHYDIYKSQMVIIIDVLWAGKPIIKEDGTYDTNKTKLKMVLNGIEKVNNREIFSWDYINDAFLKYITLNNKELICFASDENDPFFYVVCDSIEYEEIK